MKLEVKIFLYLLVFCFTLICFKLVFDWVNKKQHTNIEIRESPSNMDKIYKEILEIENNNLRKCIRENKSCVFEKEYINYIKESLNYKDVFETINIKYWENTSNYIKKNQDLIDLKFDESTTKDLLKLNQNYLNLEDSRKKKIYYNYLKNWEIERLVNLKNNSKNSKEKAIFEYQIYLLFSNVILYTK